jgi:hypothetical protein
LAGVGVLTAPGVAWAADPGAAPTLPASVDQCVGPSPVTVGDPSWAQERMAAAEAWPLSKGRGVLVAVLDTGVSGGTKALAGVVGKGADVVAGGHADSDCRGRGTALAGIVAARPVHGSGLAGVAPAADVFPVRIVGQDGQVHAAAVAAGIRAAVAAKAEVVLIGTGVAAGDAGLKKAVGEAEAADVLVVAAVSGQAENPVWYPAAYDTVLAVNGEQADGTATAALPAAAGVDLVAPGVDAVSVAPSGDGQYAVSGSAVAAAYTAGAAALLRSAQPGLTARQVRARLEATAEHPLRKADLASRGAGAVDAYAAVAGLGPEPSLLPEQPAPLVLPQPPAADRAPRVAALVSAATVAATGLALAALAWIRQVRRARLKPARQA